MPRGRRTKVQVTLTAADRATLDAWQRAHVLPAWQARRGRIILLVAEGVPIAQIARTVGISRRFVYKWVARYQAGGCAALADLPRPGPWRYGWRTRKGQEEA